MKFVYQYPDHRGPDGDMLDAGPVTDVARAAEAAGFAGISFTEHPAPSARWLESGGHQSLDPFVALACAAAVTERLRLLTFLTVAPYRNPMLLAKTAATVDKLSNGRMILGIGAGYLKAEFFALGVDFDERNDLVDEALDVLPMHWAGKPFSYDGRHFSARDAIALPRPVQDPIPIWIGGNSRRTLRRVAERAQGWMPMLGSPELATTARTRHLANDDELVAAIHELRDTAGSRAGELDVCITYGDPSIGSPAAEADRHRDRFGTLEAAGVTWAVVSGPTKTMAETLEFIDAFGRTYL